MSKSNELYYLTIKLRQQSNRTFFLFRSNLLHLNLYLFQQSKPNHNWDLYSDLNFDDEHIQGINLLLINKEVGDNRLEGFRYENDELLISLTFFRLKNNWRRDQLEWRIEEVNYCSKSRKKWFEKKPKIKKVNIK